MNVSEIRERHIPVREGILEGLCAGCRTNVKYPCDAAILLALAETLANTADTAASLLKSETELGIPTWLEDELASPDVRALLEGRDE